jgi:gliding motility-associated-like protein
VSYVLSDTTLLQSLTCDQLQAGIFTNVFTGQSGCDSVVIETINYFPPDTTEFAGETCDPMLAGTFIQTFTNTVGCDSIVIETNILLPSDTMIIIDYSCQPADTGTVSISFINSYGCDSLVYLTTALSLDDSCRVIEISKDVFIPNVFSPNNDGINDWFFISSAEGALSTITFLRIYDRWGGLVSEVFDILPNIQENGWDGTENGKSLMPGVFVWVAELKFTDGTSEISSGDVTLIR